MGARWGLVAVTAVAPMAWGTTFLVTTELLPPDRPLLAATLRALPAGLLLTAVMRRLPRGEWWWKAAVLGVLNIGAFFALLFVSAYRLPGGVAAVLGAVGPLVVAALSVPLLGARLRLTSLVLGVAGAAGVALVVLGATARLDLVGVLAGVAATTSSAAGIVLTKRWGRPVPLLAFTGWQLAAGGLVLVPLTLLVEGPPPALTTANLAGFAYLGAVGTALAYTLWLRGIQLLPAENVSFLGLVSPLVAATVGWLVLGQALTPLQLVGVAVALASILLAQLPPRVARPVPASVPAEIMGPAPSSVGLADDLACGVTRLR
ncbi:EamA family transporter [Cellulomonas sp. APG4]|uniref:EamA family transporter n=1 Tax=Cellulomonas sp. APG4 TaxID=1538656 RepID=UPI00137AE92E|nr:EamA family transporter [Cellulomonas sp. APG4]NCT90535.1 EamA family transporter [Cellulomonas sp. APG4]